MTSIKFCFYRFLDLQTQSWALWHVQQLFWLLRVEGSLLRLVLFGKAMYSSQRLSKGVTQPTTMVIFGHRPAVHRFWTSASWPNSNQPNDYSQPNNQNPPWASIWRQVQMCIWHGWSNWCYSHWFWTHLYNTGCQQSSPNCRKTRSCTCAT